MFDKDEIAVIYGRHADVMQRMLDYDYLIGRAPSVRVCIDPNIQSKSSLKLFYGKEELLIPLVSEISELPDSIQGATLINFASLRSAAPITMEALISERFSTIVIVAEGIAERQVREIIAYNESHKNILIIGPATAGAIGAGRFRLGNNGGSLENILESKLYRAGSVGFVSRSGGMSNELYRVLSKVTDGIHTGVALGWDRYLGSNFSDIILRYEQESDIKMIVLLWEVGSRDELEVAQCIRQWKITKPVVAYVSGGFAERLPTGVQFGHAGAKANKVEETASYKNKILRESGAHVPESYQDFGKLIGAVYQTLQITPQETIDGATLQKRVLDIQSRRPTLFTSTISDEREDELQYNKKPVSSYLGEYGIARVIANLWFKRDLPEYALKCIETFVILLADHGPAVSGAMNTIITARAGKDVLSSLIAGLQTIGPRFGGAIDGAALSFLEAIKKWEAPRAFVERMKREHTPIPGIGHKVKSKYNPDKRCLILRELAESLPSRHFLDYGLAVEVITLEKKPNLILNVDGHIALMLLDIFTSIGMSDAERDQAIDLGICNAFFIFSRTIGFIGHALDQKRLWEGLYRMRWEDILYAE